MLTSEQFLSQLAYRDADDHPFDVNGNMLPLKSDPDFLWTNEPNDLIHVGSVGYQRGLCRGAY